MSTSRRSTCRWSSATAGFLLVATLCARAQVPATLPPFLDEFRAVREPAIVTEDVKFASALGNVRGHLARPDRAMPLPALLLIHDEAGLNGWLRDSAAELAGIGYVVL